MLIAGHVVSVLGMSVRAYSDAGEWEAAAVPIALGGWKYHHRDFCW